MFWQRRERSVFFGNNLEIYDSDTTQPDSRMKTLQTRKYVNQGVPDLCITMLMSVEAGESRRIALWGVGACYDTLANLESY